MPMGADTAWSFLSSTMAKTVKTSKKLSRNSTPKPCPALNPGWRLLAPYVLSRSCGVTPFSRDAPKMPPTHCAAMYNIPLTMLILRVITMGRVTAGFTWHPLQAPRAQMRQARVRPKVKEICTTLGPSFPPQGVAEPHPMYTNTAVPTSSASTARQKRALFRSSRLCAMLHLPRGFLRGCASSLLIAQAQIGPKGGKVWTWRSIALSMYAKYVRAGRVAVSSVCRWVLISPVVPRCPV